MEAPPHPLPREGAAASPGPCGTPPRDPDGPCDLGAVLDAVPTPIFYKDTRGVIIGCNAAFAALTGVERGRIVGADVFGLYPREVAEWCKAFDDAVLASGEGRAQDTRMPNGDGTFRDLLVHLAPFATLGGATAGLVGTVLDVSEHRRAERSLSASEAKLRAAFDCAPMPIILMSAEGELLDYSRAFARMVGFEDDELRRGAVPALMHPEDASRCRGALQEMVAGLRDECSGEWRFRRKGDGYVQTVLHGSAVRDAAGTFLCGFALLEDVSERRALESRLMLAERLSSVGTLAAGVAHEINNPLASMLANVAFALAELPPTECSSEVRRALEDARAAAQRVHDIVRDLKTFSRQDDTRGEAADVGAALERALRLARDEIGGRAELVVEVGPIPPVAASSHRLSQVFLNLLVNAAQALAACGKAGTIWVSGGAAEDGRALVEVADTGCGIEPDVLPRIFDPFFTTRPVGAGSGLGLSICHAIVTGVGGELLVESEVGRGTRFRVLLPTARPKTSRIGR